MLPEDLSHSCFARSQPKQRWPWSIQKASNVTSFDNKKSRSHTFGPDQPAAAFPVSGRAPVSGWIGLRAPPVHEYGWLCQRHHVEELDCTGRGDFEERSGAAMEEREEQEEQLEQREEQEQDQEEEEQQQQEKEKAQLEQLEQEQHAIAVPHSNRRTFRSRQTGPSPAAAL